MIWIQHWDHLRIETHSHPIAEVERNLFPRLSTTSCCNYHWIFLFSAGPRDPILYIQNTHDYSFDDRPNESFLIELIYPATIHRFRRNTRSCHPISPLPIIFRSVRAGFLE